MFYDLVRRSAWSVSIGLTALVLTSSCGKKPSPEKAQPGPAPAAVKGEPKPGPAATAGPSIPVTLDMVIGEKSKLLSPGSLALDSAGNLYVADGGNDRVVKFDSSGRQVLAFGKKGTGLGDFQSVWSLAVDAQGQIHVLDPRTGFVLVFGPDGKYLKRFGDMGFYSPSGLALQKDGTMVVADTGGARIVRIGPDGPMRGEPITLAGGGPIEQPSDVSVDSKDGFHVHTPGGGQNGAGALVNFSAEGAFQSRWSTVPVPSTSDTPRTAEGPDGKIYLLDLVQSRIVAYSADGKTFNPLNVEGLTVPFRRLSGLAVDKQGRIYVSDADANVIYRLQTAGGAPAPAPAAGAAQGAPKKNG